ncbi:MAG TPA: hypothetical protein VK509_01870 [Polyangiales bacterium]|nr:hypothetical protein [Polyangiales bacterium]
MKRLLAVALVLFFAAPATPAVVEFASPGTPYLPIVSLSTAQTGNGDSTNTLDRGHLRGPCLLRITSTIGATPTVTVNVMASMDGTNFYNVPYATTAAPETPVVAALTITTAVTTLYILRPNHPWRFLKLVYSANTNVTLTVTVAA